jgi:ParB family chromosome partitioning protein
MKSSAKNIKLTSYDDLFSTEESRAEDQREKVVEIPITELYTFPHHPFKVRDDAAMMEMVDSITLYGVLSPCIARPRAEGGYELIAGHRRKRACELAGKNSLPVLVREIDDDAATIIMVDSNIQRDDLLPSEKAQAFKMKLEAIKRQGARSDLTSGQVDPKLITKRSNEVVAENAGESVKQVQRFIRLTELIPPIMEMVDEKKMAFNPAVELSYLDKEAQKYVMDVIQQEESTPSLSQAQRIKKYYQEGKLDRNVTEAIMSEEKPKQFKFVLPADKVQKYFPKGTTPKEVEEVILKLLEQYHRRSLERDAR